MQVYTKDKPAPGINGPMKGKQSRKPEVYKRTTNRKEIEKRIKRVQ